MQTWRRRNPSAHRRAGGGLLRSPAVHQIGLTLQRLGTRITAVSAGVHTPIGEHPGLARARVALTEARQHMPGLLGLSLATDATAVEPSARANRPAAAAEAVDTLSRAALEPDMRLSRVEEVILRFEDERRQLRSEVAALKLLTEELREALIIVDERRSRTLAMAAGPAFGPPALTEPIYPAGSVGVEIRVSAIERAAELDQFRAALATQPEVDSVRIIRSRKRKARLRVCLRFPIGRQGFFALIGRSAPTARPALGSSPATLRLRLHPS